MAKGKKRVRGKRQSTFPWKLILGVIVFIASLIPLLPTYLYLIVMMGPTWVAYLVDRNPQKFLLRSVGSVNLCGALPGLIELWILGGIGVEVGTQVLNDVYYWLYAYGAASIGWLLFTMVPRAIASFVSLKARNRIEELRRRQANLVDEWGEDVSSEVQRSLEALESMGMDDEGGGALPQPDNETGEPPAADFGELGMGDIGKLPEFGDADPVASQGRQRMAG